MATSDLTGKELDDAVAKPMTITVDPVPVQIIDATWFKVLIANGGPQAGEVLVEAYLGSGGVVSMALSDTTVFPKDIRAAVLTAIKLAYVEATSRAGAK